MTYHCFGCRVDVNVSECPRCGSELSESPKVKPRRQSKLKKKLDSLILTGNAFDIQYPVSVHTLIGRDPGNSSGTSCLFLNSKPIERTYGRHTIHVPAVSWIAQEQIDILPDWSQGSVSIVTEGQWLKGNAKKRNGILSLCASSNRWLGRECYRLRAPGYIIPVDIWKHFMIRGETTDKFVHCNRIKKLLLPHEVQMLPKGPSEHDALSSVGILFAAYLLRFDIAKFRVI